MKIIITIILASVIIYNSCSINNSVKNDLTIMNLKGKVKSLQEISYKAVLKFGKISKGKRQKDYSSGRDKYYRFNKFGNIIEEESYESNGYMHNKLIYNYDNNGNLIEEYVYNPDGSLSNKRIYKYDNAGNKTEEFQYKSNGDLINSVNYFYDEYGNLLELNIYESNGDLNQKTKYEYDNYGNKIREDDFSSNGEKYYYSTYTYDDNNISETNSYYLDEIWSALGSRTIFKYDVNSNVIFEVEYGFDGQVIRDRSFEYEYDKNGNWIKKILYRKTELKEIIVHNIVYY